VVGFFVPARFVMLKPIGKVCRLSHGARRFPRFPVRAFRLSALHSHAGF
jgi:hypothetical protein